MFSSIFSNGSDTVTCDSVLTVIFYMRIWVSLYLYSSSLSLHWFPLCRLFAMSVNIRSLMYYGRHRLTASVAYVNTLTYASTNDQWVRPAFPLVSLSRNWTVSVQLSSVKSLHTHLYTDWLCFVCVQRRLSSTRRRSTGSCRTRSSSSFCTPLPRRTATSRITTYW